MAAPGMALMLGVAACVSDDDPVDPGGEVLEGTIEVRLLEATFDRPNITIRAGSTVEWVNDGQVFHTITPQDAGQAGVWTRREMNDAGEEFPHTFTEAGQTYDYFCEPHEDIGMVGRITVVD